MVCLSNRISEKMIPFSTHLNIRLINSLNHSVLLWKVGNNYETVGNHTCKLWGAKKHINVKCVVERGNPKLL